MTPTRAPPGALAHPRIFITTARCEKAVTPVGLNIKLDPDETTLTLSRFIRDHVADAQADGVVLGLSSGLDSAVAAALATRALGPEKVHPVFMSGSTTPKTDGDEAKSIARSLGLELEEHRVDKVAQAIVEATGYSDRDTLANATARARMIVLYAIARKKGLLVLGPSNKSELLVGYFTKHGDGACDLMPMGDLYKTQVRILAGHLGLPESVLKKPPTAGLWEGQTDEQELGMDYQTLDPILLGFELGLSNSEIAKETGVEHEGIVHVERMFLASEHKRKPAHVCKIGIRTLTSDWRRAVTQRDSREA